MSLNLEHGKRIFSIKFAELSEISNKLHFYKKRVHHPIEKSTFVLAAFLVDRIKNREMKKAG